MTNDTRSPAEIEREIEERRRDLSSNLEELQDKISVSGMLQQATDQLRENGGDIGRAFYRQVKANPVPLALTGIGLAWMMMSNNSSSAPRGGLTRRDDHYRDHGHSDYGSRDHAVGRTGYQPATTRTHATGAPTYSGAGASGGRATPSWAQGSPSRGHDHGGHDDGSSRWDDVADAAKSGAASVKSGAATARDSVSGAAHSAGSAAKTAGSSVSDAARSAGSSVSDAASSAGTSVSGAASQAGSKVSGAARSARDTVSGAASSSAEAMSDAARSVRDSVSRFGQQIADGTESLSEEARARVVAARRRAIELGREVSPAISRGAEATADYYDRQPMVFGALALAVGAALGSAIPRTRTEDAYLGEHSDQLFDEAERIFNEEREKAERVAQATMDEARNVASDVKEQVRSAASDAKDDLKAEAKGKSAEGGAKTPVGRVAKAARKSAEKEKLGKPKS